MKKTTLTKEELLEIGFVEKACIIHPSRTTKDVEEWLGQIDENGNQRELLVFYLPAGFRFEKHIAVNYRGEVFVYTSGFMRGGIEAFADTEDSDFYFRETDEWKNETQRILKKLFAE